MWFHTLAVVGWPAIHGAPPSLPSLIVVDGRRPPAAAANGLGVHGGSCCWCFETLSQLLHTLAHCRRTVKISKRTRTSCDRETRRSGEDDRFLTRRTFPISPHQIAVPRLACCILLLDDSIYISRRHSFAQYLITLTTDSPQHSKLSI